MQHPDEFIEELDAFDPKWKERYRTPLDAAKAAGNIALYHHWIQNGSGKARAALLAGVPDTVAANEAARELRRRMYLLAAWGATYEPEDDREEGLDDELDSML